jgi:hypothetical protein
MSVLMILRLDADPAKLEEVAGKDPDRMKAILDEAKDRGLIAHRFYGTGTGKVVVVDQWESADGWQSFFSAASDDIRSVFQEVGVGNQPVPEFWRELETHDKYGWGA